MGRGWIGKVAVWVVAAAGLAAAFLWWTRPRPVAVTVATVAAGPVERTLANTRAGTVVACQRARLSLPTGGQIAAIPVKEGAQVVAGELLVELWNQDLKALLRQARLAARSSHLEHDAVCIDADNAARESSRLQRLVGRQLASQELAEQAQARAAAAQASCAAAKARQEEAGAAVAVAEAQLEKTRLYAPFAGILAEVRGEVGEYSTPSPPGVATPPAIDLLTDDCHYIEAPMDEVDAAALDTRLPVRVSFDAIAGRSFAGRIRRIAPYVLDTEKQARTVTIEVVLTDAELPRLYAGYSSDVEVVLERRDNSLRIPTEALLEGRYVLRFIPGEPLERVEIEPGFANWRYTEVVTGLAEGEQVVTSLGREGVAAGVEAQAE
ncbi:efflux RND transporter periplasmic adaptor subunit [Motiliproteus sp. SC1-56]|uniref:efflux RND transporter periplasmic adaptor subunit n=1 Tax=Motiliproteus sp. SC1-56 TaxID=2799565 RepID=UPI001A8EC59F